MFTKSLSGVQVAGLHHFLCLIPSKPFEGNNIARLKISSSKENLLQRVVIEADVGRDDKITAALYLTRHFDGRWLLYEDKSRIQRYGGQTFAKCSFDSRNGLYHMCWGTFDGTSEEIEQETIIQIARDTETTKV